MTPSQSVATQQTWRLRDPRNDRTRSKMWRIVIWTVVFLVLVVCIAGYFYWRLDYHYTYVGVLVTQHDLLAVPHLAYQQNDEKAWRQYIEDRVANDRGYRRLSEATGLEYAADDFANSEAGSRDAEILYVSTHGMAFHGKAYLMKSSFLRASQSAKTELSPNSERLADGLYDAGELLQRLSQSRAGLKLLVLDAGRIAYDPRLGILLNDFPSLLAQVVRDDVADGRLWVLVSHSTGQISGEDSGSGESLFAQSVVEGLRGAADQCGNRDGKVMLDELYQYVWSDVTQWKISDRSLQTPMLLQGGKGSVDLAQARDCHIVLAMVPEQKPDDAEAKQSDKTGDSSGEKGGTATRRRQWPHSLALATVTTLQTPVATSPDSATPPDQGTPPTVDGQVGNKTEAAKTTPAKEEVAKEAGAAVSAADEPSKVPSNSGLGAATKIPTEAASPPQETATESPANTLRQIWQLRDQLVDIQPGAWSPIDFAPVSWRRFEALLVQAETRLRSGAGTSDDLGLLLRDVQKFAEEMKTGTVSSYKTLYVSQIAEDWREFAQGSQRRVLERPEMHTLTSAWQLGNRTLYELPSFIRWQALSVLTEQEVTCPDDLRVNSVEHLAELSDMLGAVGRSLTPEMEQRIRAQQSELATTYGELRNKLQMAWQRASEAAANPIADRLLDALLATPLLDAPQRTRLIAKQAAGATARQISTARQVNVATPDVEAPAPPWETLRKIVVWQVDYVRLCDPSSTSLRAPQVLDQANARSLGEAFQQYYENVPAALGTSQNHALVWLIDPRDQPRSRLVIRGPELPQVVPPPPPVKLEIAAIPEPLRLQWRKPVEATLSFTGQGLQDNRVTVHVQYDAERLVVRRTPDGDKLANDTSFPFPLTDAPTQRLALYLEATRLANAGSELADLSVELLGVDSEGMPRKTEPQRIMVRMPLPSDVAVWTVRHSSDPEEPEFRTGSRIKPYPNRTTSFAFLLANRSQIQKTVKVELYAIPDPRKLSSLPPNWAPGRIFVSGELRKEVDRLVLEGDENQTVRPDVRKLAEALVTLPAADDTRLPIAFQPPGSLAPKPPADNATPPPPPQTPLAAPPVPADEKIDVSHGMALVMTNVNDPTDRIVKWIGILPAHPSQYLQVSNVRYVGQQVRADVQLPNPQAIPAVRDNPVEVVWTNLDTQRFVNRAAVALLTDEPSRQRSELWAEVPPNTPDCAMQLAVDGYPRAFAYDIRCAENETGRSLANRQLAIRIVGLTPVYKKPQDPEKQPVEIPLVAASDGTSEVAIRSDPENPCTHVVVRFELDVPENAFESLEPLASARIDGLELFCDRQVETTLEKLAPGGSLLLTSQVRDYQVPINVEGRTPVVIRAELQKRGEEGLSSQITAILDGMAPRVERLDNLPSQVEVKTPLPLDVEFTDNNQSGVGQLVVAIDVNASGTIDDGDPQKSIDINRDKRRQHVELPTDDVKPNSDGYRVLAQVTDRVGIRSVVRAADTLVRVDAMKKVVPPKLTKGTICGTLYVNDRPARLTDGRVTIKELGKAAELDGANFRFDDVPMGTYTLQASGSLSGYPYVSNPDAPPQATPKPPATAKFSDHRIDLSPPRADQKK